MVRRQGPQLPSLIYDKAFEADGVMRREAADSHQGQGHDRSSNRPDKCIPRPLSERGIRLGFNKIRAGNI